MMRGRLNNLLSLVAKGEGVANIWISGSDEPIYLSEGSMMSFKTYDDLLEIHSAGDSIHLVPYHAVRHVRFTLNHPVGGPDD